MSIVDDWINLSCGECAKIRICKMSIAPYAKYYPSFASKPTGTKLGVCCLFIPSPETAPWLFQHWTCISDYIDDEEFAFRNLRGDYLVYLDSENLWEYAVPCYKLRKIDWFYGKHRDENGDLRLHTKVYCKRGAYGKSVILEEKDKSRW